MSLRSAQSAFFSSLLLAALLAACSSSETLADSGTTPADAGIVDAGPTGTKGEQLTQQIIHSLCAAQVRCGNVAVGDADTCYAVALQQGGVGSYESFVTAIDTGKVVTDESTLADCLSALQNYPCTSSFDEVLHNTCSATFQGQLADGDNCVSELECPQNSFCQRARSGTDLCAAQCVKFGVGCKNTSECASGQFCQQGTCSAPTTPPAAFGEECPNGALCQTGLTCVSSEDPIEMTQTSTCQMPNGSGGPCGVNSECAAGFSCDHSSQICKSLGTQGSPCSYDGVRCSDGLVCVPSDDGATSTCQTPKGLGESCTQLFECGGVYDLYVCDEPNQKCVARPSTGICPAPFEIPYGGCDIFQSYCDTSISWNFTCKPFKNNGEACSNVTECGNPYNGASCTGTPKVCVIPTSAPHCEETTAE